MSDYYNTLGVSKDASKDEIKRAYKELAKKNHPDLHKGDKQKEERFKEISEAYRVLSDDQARQNYDQYGSAEGMGTQGFGGDFNFGGFDFGDIFSSFFGGRQRRRGPRRGADIQYDMEISLEEAFEGFEKEIPVTRYEKCKECKGLGGDKMKTCSDCKGQGVTQQTRRTPFGIFSTTAACNTCNGEGQAVENRCSSCKGTGLKEKTRKIKVKVPKGVDTGATLRLRGEGEAGAKGAGSGDMFVFLHVAPHKQFRRKGSDLYTRVPISFVTAALGGKIDVESIDEEAELKIPEGTQTHTLFRIKGKGMPHLNAAGRGDLYVQAIVEIPKKVNSKQKKLLKEFEKEGQGLLKKLKAKMK